MGIDSELTSLDDGGADVFRDESILSDGKPMRFDDVEVDGRNSSNPEPGRDC